MFVLNGFKFHIVKESETKTKDFKKFIPHAWNALTLMVLFLNWAGKMQVYHEAAFERIKWQEGSNLVNGERRK